MATKLDENYAKSLELAKQIEAMKHIIVTVDTEHLKNMVEKFSTQASFEDSAAVLNAAYDPKKSTLLRVMSHGLQCLLNFIDDLKECDKLKKEIKQTDQARSEIAKLFM